MWVEFVVGSRPCFERIRGLVSKEKCGAAPVESRNEWLARLLKVNWPL